MFHSKTKRGNSLDIPKDINKNTQIFEKRTPSSSKVAKNGLAIIAEHFSSFTSKGFVFGSRRKTVDPPKGTDNPNKELKRQNTNSKCRFFCMRKKGENESIKDH